MLYPEQEEGLADLIQELHWIDVTKRLVYHGALEALRFGQPPELGREKAQRALVDIITGKIGSSFVRTLYGELEPKLHPESGSTVTVTHEVRIAVSKEAAKRTVGYLKKVIWGEIIRAAKFQGRFNPLPEEDDTSRHIASQEKANLYDDQEVVDRTLTFFEDDAVAQAVVRVILVDDVAKPAEIANLLGLEPKDIYNAYKRIKRRREKLDRYLGRK